MSARGFEKYAATGTITATEKTYTSTLTASNLTVLTPSNYSISFTLADPLATTAMIILTVPVQIRVSSCPQVNPSSTIRQSPNCSISNNGSNYVITMTGLNSSSSMIASGQRITIDLGIITNYYSAISLPAISLKIYYTSDTVDLVAISTTNRLTLLPNYAYVNSISVLNGNTKTLQSPVQYQVYVNLMSGMPVGSGLITITIDTKVKVGASVNSTHQFSLQLVDSTNVSNIIS